MRHSIAYNNSPIASTRETIKPVMIGGQFYNNFLAVAAQKNFKQKDELLLVL